MGLLLLMVGTTDIGRVGRARSANGSETFPSAC
jgi:hypothetical protein